MNVSDWPMQKIMSLPDHCFGRRWSVGLAALFVGAGGVFDISEAGLPERCVVWGVVLAGFGSSTASAECVLALGDVLPATDAQFDVLDLLMREVIVPGGRRGGVETPCGGGCTKIDLRLPVLTSGRRLVARFARGTGTATRAVVYVVVSSMPTEVPDWLLSH